MSLWAGLLLGFAFGFILQRVGALDYGNILRMLRLINMKIAQFMFFSIAVAAVGIFYLNRTLPVSLNTLPLHLGVVVGAVIFGVGFALAGYCPGTCVGAMAEGKKDALFTFLGALTGTLLYALSFRWLDPLILQKWQAGNLVLTRYLPFDPLVDAIVYAVAIIALLVVVEKYFRGLPEN